MLLSGSWRQQQRPCMFWVMILLMANPQAVDEEGYALRWTTMVDSLCGLSFGGAEDALNSMICCHWQSCWSIRRSETQVGLSRMRWCHCHRPRGSYQVRCWSCQCIGMPSQSVAYDGVVHRTGSAFRWLMGGCVTGDGVVSNSGWVPNLSSDVIVGLLLFVCVPLL